MERRELAAWLRLQLTPGLGSAAQRRLLAALGTPEQILAASPAAYRSVLTPAVAAALAQEPQGLAELLDRSWNWLQAAPRRQLLSLGDARYPASLLQTADPPPLLYAEGQLDWLHVPALAIVGSRRPTAQGRDTARELAHDLAEAGLCIVSGLALGIDGAAHEGALQGGGGTIAVLGTGLDRLYPPTHRSLGLRIAEQGLLLSEYPPGTPPLPAHFPRRNRIIAGLSQGCLVVEAALQSGSLITARLAAEAGREVFAVPGSIHAAQSRGCHALLREGAKLVETALDVLEELHPSRPRPPRGPAPRATPVVDLASPAPQLAPTLEAVLAAMGHDPVSLDALQARGGWPTGELNALLLELELAGAVARLPGSLFQRRAQG